MHKTKILAEKEMIKCNKIFGNSKLFHSNGNYKNYSVCFPYVDLRYLTMG